MGSPTGHPGPESLAQGHFYFWGDFFYDWGKFTEWSSREIRATKMKKNNRIDENGNYIVDEGGCFSDSIPDDVHIEYGKPVPPDEPGNISPVKISFQSKAVKTVKRRDRK